MREQRGLAFLPGSEPPPFGPWFPIAAVGACLFIDILRLINDAQGLMSEQALAPVWMIADILVAILLLFLCFYFIRYRNRLRP